MTRDQIQTVLDALTTVDSCVGLKNYFHDKPDGTDVRLDQVVDDAIAILQALAEPSEPVAALDVTIDDENALALLRDFVVQEDGDFTPIRLLVSDGHSGYGLYIAAAAIFSLAPSP